MGFYSRVQGNKGLNIRGAEEHMQFGEKVQIEIQGFDFEEKGNKAIYFMGTREQVPHGKGLKVAP